MTFCTFQEVFSKRGPWLFNCILAFYVFSKTSKRDLQRIWRVYLWTFQPFPKISMEFHRAIGECAKPPTSLFPSTTTSPQPLPKVPHSCLPSYVLGGEFCQHCHIACFLSRKCDRSLHSIGTKAAMVCDSFLVKHPRLFSTCPCSRRC